MKAGHRRESFLPCQNVRNEADDQPTDRCREPMLRAQSQWTPFENHCSSIHRIACEEHSVDEGGAAIGRCYCALMKRQHVGTMDPVRPSLRLGVKRGR